MSVVVDLEISFDTRKPQEVNAILVSIFVTIEHTEYCIWIYLPINGRLGFGFSTGIGGTYSKNRSS